MASWKALTQEQIKQIREYRKTHTGKETGEKFGVSRQTVSYYVHNKKKPSELNRQKRRRHVDRQRRIAKHNKFKFLDRYKDVLTARRYIVLEGEMAGLTGKVTPLAVERQGFVLTTNTLDEPSRKQLILRRAKEYGYVAPVLEKVNNTYLVKETDPDKAKTIKNLYAYQINEKLGKS